MKLTRILYAIVTVIVATSLFISALAEWQDSGTEEARHYVGYALVSICYMLGALGVICLGWYQLRLTGAVTSIAALLQDEKSGEIRACKRFGWTKTNEIHITYICIFQIKKYREIVRNSFIHIYKYKNEIKRCALMLE